MATTQNMRHVGGGRWVPAVPIPAPWDIRLRCEHTWTPHVHANGMTSHLDYDCTRCGAKTESPAHPGDGRSWLGRLLARLGW